VGVLREQKAKCQPPDKTERMSDIMKTIYYATYTTDNGTHPCEPYEYTNKREAIREIRKIASGETYAGGYADVKVWTGDTEVYAARVR
jgi:hypothetical protein